MNNENIIFIQLLTIFVGLFFALIRLISFKCKNGRLYKISSDLFVKFFICFILAVISATICKISPYLAFN